MMKLNVASKIILGFSTVLVFYIVASIISVNILSGIDGAAKQVNEFASPAQDRSIAIEISLLKQANISSSIPVTKTREQLSQLQTEFGQIEAELLKSRQALPPLLSSENAVNQLNLFDQKYQDYLAQVQSMFALKEAYIAQTEQTKTEHAHFVEALNVLEEALIELSYIEDEDNESLIEQISSVSVQIEGYIISLKDSLSEVITLTETNSVVELQETIGLGLTNTEQLFVYLGRLVEGHSSEPMVADIKAQYDDITHRLQAEKSLFSLHLSALNSLGQLSDTAEMQRASSTQSVEAIEALAALVKQRYISEQEKIIEHVAQGTSITIVVVIVIFILGGLIAFFTIRAMVLPLARVNSALSKLAKGDLTNKVDVTTNDEYGLLAKNVNQVVDDLKALIGEISQNAHELNSNAAQSNIEISEVASSLNKQKDQIANVAMITTQLRETADNVLTKAHNAEQETSNAQHQSTELESLANVSSERIDSLAHMLDDTNSLMATLRTEANNIGGILDTIQAIADQTNLLALNAAIEAARAGESGRGFAVVADEVRMLASRTQESIAEIHGMITTLQKYTEAAVTDIDKGKQEADVCQQYTAQLLDTLTLINQAIESIHANSSEIAQEATQQNSLSDSISESILQVENLSQESADKSEATIAHSQQVAKLSSKLEKSVDQFSL